MGEELREFLLVAFQRLDLQRRLADYLAMIQNDQPVEPLLVELESLSRHADAQVRRRVLEVIGQLPADMRALELVRRSCQDPSWTVREVAVKLLPPFAEGNTGMREVVALEISLRIWAERSELVREAATRTLTVLRGDVRDKVTAMLVESLADSRPTYRCRAVAGLSHLPSLADVHLTSILRLMDDSHRRVRKSAVEAFERLGAARRAALPTLVRRRFDGDPAVADAAKRALGVFLVDPVPDRLRRDVLVVLESDSSPAAFQFLLESAEASERAALEELQQRRVAWRKKLGAGRLNDADATWLLGKLFASREFA